LRCGLIGFSEALLPVRGMVSPVLTLLASLSQGPLHYLELDEARRTYSACQIDILISLSHAILFAGNLSLVELAYLLLWTQVCNHLVSTVPLCLLGCHSLQVQYHRMLHMTTSPHKVQCAVPRLVFPARSPTHMLLSQPHIKRQSLLSSVSCLPEMKIVLMSMVEHHPNQPATTPCERSRKVWPGHI
jgi:hypothetical protein